MRIKDLSPSTCLNLYQAEPFAARSAIRRAAAAGFLKMEKDGRGRQIVQAADLARLDERLEDARDALSWARGLGLMRTHKGRAGVCELKRALQIKQALEAQQEPARAAGQGDLFGWGAV